MRNNGYKNHKTKLLKLKMIKTHWTLCSWISGHCLCLLSFVFVKPECPTSTYFSLCLVFQSEMKTEGVGEVWFQGTVSLIYTIIDHLSVRFGWFFGSSVCVWCNCVGDMHLCLRSCCGKTTLYSILRILAKGTYAY